MKKRDVATRSQAETKLTKRLTAYSATAGAALACAHPAAAAITNITLSDLSQDSLTFNPFVIATKTISAGPLDLRLKYSATHAASGQRGALFFSGTPNLEIGARPGYVNELGAGGAVQFQAFRSHGLVIAEHVTNTGGTNEQIGDFNPNGGASAAVTGYIALRRVTNGQTYFGWLRIQTKNNSDGILNQISFVPNTNGIYGAWELPGDGLTVGETAAVPEPSTAALGGLGLLALGAMGVRELRRRQAVLES